MAAIMGSTPPTQGRSGSRALGLLGMVVSIEWDFPIPTGSRYFGNRDEGSAPTAQRSLGLVD